MSCQRAVFSSNTTVVHLSSRIPPHPPPDRHHRTLQTPQHLIMSPVVAVVGSTRTPPTHRCLSAGLSPRLMLLTQGGPTSSSSYHEDRQHYRRWGNRAGEGGPDGWGTEEGKGGVEGCGGGGGFAWRTMAGMLLVSSKVAPGVAQGLAQPYKLHA